MPKLKLTPEQRAEVVAIYTSTPIGSVALGAKFGVGHGTVLKALHDAGVDTSRSARAKFQHAEGVRKTRAGATWTDEQHARYSKARKGRAVTVGHKFTDESRRKMSEARKRYFAANPKAREMLADSARKRSEAKRLPPEEKAARNAVRRLSKRLVQRLLKRQNKRKDAQCHILLGYTAQELREHIAAQFQPGMSWADPATFHIDHIVPVRVFADHGVCDVSIINALCNLRPLYPSENRAKSDRYDGDFLADLEAIKQNLTARRQANGATTYTPATF